MDKSAEDTKLTLRRFRDGDHAHRPWQEEIFEADYSHKCPTYVHRTPPCQGSCPSGEDIRGWLNIARGIEKASGDLSWQEYAFRRITDANPFPAIMGRVCPAPCEDGCNRNEVEDHVGINAVEQFIGDTALEKKFRLPAAAPDTGKRVAIIGGGPAGLACAYQARRRGHACTIFESHADLGGMMRYGIPGYRTPREVLSGEIDRILALGVEVKANTRVGVDIPLDRLERDYDAIFVGLGAQTGTGLTVPGWDAPNCISGISFLEAFNDGRLRFAAGRVLVIGGGDTAMDVAAVARRLGHIKQIHEKDRPEHVVLGQTAHDVATVAKREGSDVMIVYRRPIEKMPATRMEIEHVTKEGVAIRSSLIPVEVLKGSDGRARALRVAEVEWQGRDMKVKEGSEFDIDCDLVVAAIGQVGDFRGMETLNNGKGLVNADPFYRVPNHPKYFVGGDIVRPHLLTTAVGHASIAIEVMDHLFRGDDPARRPKVDVHHFNLLGKLREFGLEPSAYDHQQVSGTAEATFAVHNYEDRSRAEVVPSDQLFLGHFEYAPRHQRTEQDIDSASVLGHFGERLRGLTLAEAVAEAGRCMSCGMCFECDNCVVFCPQIAVKRVKKKDATMGRYVETDYSRCIGCHICADVCPSGYIQMGLGE